MHFRVLEGKESRPAELVFGRESDLSLLREWRLPPKLRRHEPARDAVAFARLATKRWRYHRRTGRIITRAAELRDAAARQTSEELTFLLLARAGWSTRAPILGLAHCRRTWCGHLFVDFLSVHPSIAAQQEPRIRAVGTGILCALCELAGQSGISTVWGETTSTSVSFYRKALNNPALLDCFVISGAVFDQCRRRFREMEILPDDSSCLNPSAEQPTFTP